MRVLGHIQDADATLSSGTQFPSDPVVNSIFRLIDGDHDHLYVWNGDVWEIIITQSNSNTLTDGGTY